MAAIDKLWLNNYLDFDELRVWVIIHKPSLLKQMYTPFQTYEDWKDYKQKKFQNDKDNVEDFFTRFPSFKAFEEYWKGMCIEITTYDYYNKLKIKEKIEDEIKYKNNISIAVANFTLKQDRWLFWRCPLPCIREYLINQCGYKERWYHRLLFKFTIYND